jgi:hypothetical protein
MKILFFGNTNNHFFEFITHLTQTGHIVTHVITQKGKLHDPFEKNNKYDKEPNLKFIDLREIGEEHLILHEPKVLNIFNQHFDLAFLEEMGPSFFKYIKCPIISINIGYNVTNYMDKNFSINRSSSWSDEFKQSNSAKNLINKYNEFVYLQREGFSQSSKIMTLPTGTVPSEDSIFDEIKVSEKKYLFPYIPKVNKIYRIQTHKRNFKKKLQLQILFPARLDSPKMHPGYSERNDKGTDNLFESIKNLSDSGFFKFSIFNKGMDAPNFIERLRKYDLLKNIQILDTLSYPKFLKVLSRFDIVIDSVGKSPPGRITTDALQLGVPVICNLNDTFIKALSRESFDVTKYLYHANTSLGIVKSIENILEHYNSRSFDLIDLQKQLSIILDLEKQFSYFIRDLFP